MKQAAQSDSRQAQNLGLGPARTALRHQTFAPAGHLVQLAAMMNGSPRVEPLAQQKDDLQQSSCVQNLARLSAEINRGAPAQLRGVDPGLEPEEASPHAQGAEIHPGPVPEEHLPYQDKRAPVHGLNFPGIVQRVIVKTVPSASFDPEEEEPQVYDVDLSGIIAAELADNQHLLVAQKALEATKLHYEQLALKYEKEGKAQAAAASQQAVSDIVEALGYIADPRSSKFYVATPGKRVGSSATDFESIKATVGGLLEAREDYGKEIARTRATYPDSAELRGYRKLKEYVGPFTSIAGMVLKKNAQLTDEVITLFSWLIPLHDETIKAIDNKQSLMYRIKTCLSEKTGMLQEIAKGVSPLPMESLIRYGATKTIGDYQLGTKSEIKTALPGALKSGEKSTARNLESALSEYYAVPFVAGHLVADTLGGKNVADNLAPITNTFNTSGGSQGIKDPENDALSRLKSARVIFYSTSVTYGNAANLNWRLAVQPTRVQVRVTTLLLGENGDPTDIGDYQKVQNEKIYILSPIIQTRY